MRVTKQHVFWGTAAWVISSTACLSNDVQLIEYTGSAEGQSNGGSGGDAKEMPVPTAGAGMGGSGGSAPALVNAAGAQGIGGGSGSDAQGGGGSEGVLAGGAAGEGGAAGSIGDGGTAGSTSTCVTGADCLSIQTRLPAPCAGIPYSELFSITGGTAPYEVALLSGAGEFELRQEGGAAGEWRVVSTGSAGPSAGGVLQVTVTDGSSPPLTETVEIELTLRSSCWFAYLAEEGPALALVPITKAGPLGSVLSVPSLDELQGGRVVDFKFSPDGRRLAARWLDVGGTHRLMAFDAPYWRESFASVSNASVLHYEWSPDSTVLAFAVSDEGGTALGGARWGSAPRAEPVALTPLRVVIDSEVFWIGSGLVAFHRPDAQAFRRIGYAQVAATGFEEFIPSFQPIQYSLEGLQLKASPRGLFVIAPLDGGFEFVDATPAALSLTYHEPDVVLSPSFGHTAHSLGGELLVYPASSAGLGFAEPLEESAACERVLTWSTRGDRILCATATSLDVLRVSETGARPDFSLTTHTGLHAFEGQRRVFSPGGRWLAYVIDPEGPLSEDRGFLFIANMDLGSIDPNVRPISLNTEAQVELEFSPDDDWLFIHIGPRLRLLPLAAGYYSNQVLDVALGEPGPCSETFSDTQPPWCGTRGRGRIRWSPESDIAAVLTASGAVAVVPTVALPQEPSPVMSVSCGATCRYEFQPSINQEGL